ncbi:PLP-dependent aminotransferase family protein [Larsenimonas rhizosphaerae]|uniref:MocR-like pyridoxine biosynthesis transcription factor PdxR n=1 Tax=Larsenimonas rhizosphaerae TaxID=2944682 RepID=UPI00203384CF|nr:PLP-dependent aminotransferase family protein [Larsenimonas rhizosphaerae]MCM2131791.1 PLP-dependent aminotransferase family protein [Larsenimonas rhizosphaerae]
MSRTAIVSLNFSLQGQGGHFYRQLIDQIVEFITQGKLKAHDRLPGSRVLASSLGISRSTVVNAYDQLIAQGVLVSKHKSGVFVAEQAGYITQSSRPVVGDSDTGETPPPSVIGFSSTSDAGRFPEKAWLRSLRTSWASVDPRVLDDSCPTGLPDLKQAISDYLYQLRGLACSPQQILITAGNRDALTLLRHALASLSPGSAWITENPAYPPIHRLLESWRPEGSARASMVLPVDEEGCCLPDETLTGAAPIVLLTPNRQYPTGISLGRARRQQWLALLQQRRCWLIEDDYDNEFVYSGRSTVPMMQADVSERTFLVGSLSKVLFRGLRLGFIVSPPACYSTLLESRRQLGGSAALPMQPVVAEFINNGEFARHINRMRRHYRQKRDELLRLLDQHLRPWFDWQAPSGGMHVVIRFREAVSASGRLSETATRDQMVARDLMNEGIRLQPLSLHFVGESADSQGFILGFTAPSMAAMSCMVTALKRYLIRADASA